MNYIAITGMLLITLGVLIDTLRNRRQAQYTLGTKIVHRKGLDQSKTYAEYAEQYRQENKPTPVQAENKYHWDGER